MTFTMLTTQSAPVIGSPVKADGTSSTAKLAGANYASSDPTVFTVSPDPATPNGAIIKGVGAGSATLTETATATEPDGINETITGSATIIITVAPPPPPAPAAALVFTFGTPTP